MDSVLPGSAVDDIKFQDECRNLETASCVHICEKLASLFSLRKVRGDIGLGVNVGATHQDSVYPPCRLCGGRVWKKMCKYIADVQFVASTRSNAHVKKSLVKFYSTSNNFPLIFSR